MSTEELGYVPLSQEEFELRYALKRANEANQILRGEVFAGRILLVVLSLAFAGLAGGYWKLIQHIAG